MSCASHSGGARRIVKWLVIVAVGIAAWPHVRRAVAEKDLAADAVRAVHSVASKMAGRPTDDWDAAEVARTMRAVADRGDPLERATEEMMGREGAFARRPNPRR